jgi:hypothetical protein
MQPSIAVTGRAADNGSLSANSYNGAI